MSELHSHCQCDNCSGEDCGQDNPEEYEKRQEEERADIRQAERDKVLDELRTIKQYDTIRFHEKYTLPKSWSEAKVHEIFKSGRLGISYVAAGSRCTTEKSIDLDQVRYVCRWIELRQKAGE